MNSVTSTLLDANQIAGPLNQAFQMLIPYSLSCKNFPGIHKHLGQGSRSRKVSDTTTITTWIRHELAGRKAFQKARPANYNYRNDRPASPVVEPNRSWCWDSYVTGQPVSRYHLTLRLGIPGPLTGACVVAYGCPGIPIGAKRA